MTTPSTRGRIAPPAATGTSGGAGRDSHSRPVAAGNLQRLVIEGWHPKTSANRSHDHWRKTQQAHHHDRDMAWASATHAGWVFVPGRVKLTITLIYARKYRLDADNLAAKCKGLIDGLTGVMPGRDCYGVKRQRDGWFTDDSTDWLELEVRAEVRRGIKQTEITLEPLP